MRLLIWTRSLETQGCCKTTGVGLADDFNHFVNLGLLLGNRVVLWDTVILGTFFPPDRRLDRDAIARVAGEFLYLMSVIKEGGVVMLPHPSIWLERCRRYMQAVSGIDGLTPAFAGYVNARALRDEGFDVHPYTLTKGGELSVEFGAPDPKGPLNTERSIKNRDSMKDLMCDTRFAYLRDLDTTRLYQFLKHEDGWKSELAGLLRIPDYVKTQEDTHRHLAAVKDALETGINAQNDSFAVDKADLAASGLSFIACAIGIACSPYDAGQILGAIGGSMSLVTAWACAFDTNEDPDRRIGDALPRFQVASNGVRGSAICA